MLRSAQHGIPLDLKFSAAASQAQLLRHAGLYCTREATAEISSLSRRGRKYRSSVHIYAGTRRRWLKVYLNAVVTHTLGFLGDYFFNCRLRFINVDLPFRMDLILMKIILRIHSIVPR